MNDVSDSKQSTRESWTTPYGVHDDTRAYAEHTERYGETTCLVV